jgi:hypothetical protein
MMGRRSSCSGVVLLAALLPVLGVSSASGQSPPGEKRLVRTYDVTIVGSVRSTAPDIVLVEKATHTYRRVRVIVLERAGRVSVFPADYNLAPDQPKNGVMSGEVVFQQAGSAPCSQSKRFRGAARLDISGQLGRSVGAGAGWAGAPGGARLTEREWKCPGLFNLPGAGHPWEHAKGLLTAQFASDSALVFWRLARTSRGLPFPLDRLRAGRSFAAEVSGSANDGFLVEIGRVRATFTAR